MKSTNFPIVRYDADEGKVFDWAEPRYVDVEVEGKETTVQEHLFVKTLFIGGNDNINNYIEVPEPIVEGQEE